jgi:chromodomain-helicase-DNA-binding protein 1
LSKQPTPALRTSTSDTDSDDVYVNNKKTLTKKLKRRQHDVANGLAPPTHGEVRFSSRRGGKVMNYNEDDNDQFDDEEDEMTSNYAALEYAGPQVDRVLDHRLKEGLIMNPDLTKSDFEYLIKWRGKAVLHASWETVEPFLQIPGSKRKIENYFEREIGGKDGDIYWLTYPNVVAEDKEEWSLRREKKLTVVEKSKEIDRVIGSRDEGDGTEYFVKWKELPYDDCTWESAELVSILSQDEIDNYLNRISNLPKSKQRTKLAHTPLRTQPDYIKNGQLREFQLKGLNFLAHNWCQGKNVMLADEMGLGKTVQTVCWLSWLMHEQSQQGPFLIVIPLTVMAAWTETFKTWAPQINFVTYYGKPTSRMVIQEYEMGDPRKPKFNVVITTYDLAIKDIDFFLQFKWQVLAVDEAHRLKNKDAKLYGVLSRLNVPSRLLITGTPMQNTLEELKSLMDFLDVGSVDIPEDLDLQSDQAARVLREITDKIRPYMMRRTKEVVEKDLPKKTELVLRVELSNAQLDLYKAIISRNYEALNAGSSGKKTSLLNIMMEMKKASNHAFMFPNHQERLLEGVEHRDEELRALITNSGKMMVLDKLLTKMKSEGHRVLIFSQMVKMLDILEWYLKRRGHKFQRIDGGVGAAERQEAIKCFNAPDSEDFVFVLSTRAGGLGINLVTADTVVIFDSDWNPHQDLQAMSRAHRIGQTRPVTVYRFVSKETVEEEILERARNKLILEYITIARAVEPPTDARQRQLGDKLAQVSVTTAEPTTADEISRILKLRSQKMFEQTDNQKKLEELDIDAVLASAEEHKTEQVDGFTADGGEEFLKSFEYTDVKVDLDWDDIIPKDELATIKAEEQKRKEEEQTMALIEQSMPRNRKAPASNAPQGPQPRAAKKKARAATKEVAIDSDDGDDESEAGKDPKRPLTTSETRRLHKAYEKWGAFDEKQQEIIRDAKLTGRDPTLLKRTIDEMYDKSEQLVKDADNRLDAQPVSKKDRHEVTFEYNGVKRINARTMIERASDMRIIRQSVSAAKDWKTYRIPEASKSADFTCDWGAREDAMMVVGMARHGFGSWVQIRDDPELNMKEKFFLEEQRVEKKDERQKTDDKDSVRPQAVHAVRRAKYLITVLRSKVGNTAAAKALENHHRNTKKLHAGPTAGLNSKIGSTASSPAPRAGTPLARKLKAEKARDRGNSQSEARLSVDRRLPNGRSERNGTPDTRLGKDVPNDLKRRHRDDDGGRHDHKRHRSSLEKDGETNRHRRTSFNSNDVSHKRRRDNGNSDYEKKPHRSSNEHRREDDRGHKRRREEDDYDREKKRHRLSDERHRENDHSRKRRRDDDGSDHEQKRRRPSYETERASSRLHINGEHERPKHSHHSHNELKPRHGDEQLQRDNHPSTASQRSTNIGSSHDASLNAHFAKMFEHQKDRLHTWTKTFKSPNESKENRSAAARAILQTFAHGAEELKRNGESELMQQQLWDYAAEHLWTAKKQSGEQLKVMHLRLLENDKQKKVESPVDKNKLSNMNSSATTATPRPQVST